MTLSTAPAQGAITITPSDTVPLTKAIRGIYVGGDGNVSVLHPDGSTGVYVGVGAGTVLPVAASRVNATGTTATNMTGLV